MDENRTAALSESRERLNRPDRRIVMLIICVALQWVLILVCILYMAVFAEKSHKELPQAPKDYAFTELIKNALPSNSTKLMLERRRGNMTVKNGSIEIPSTGFYVVYLEGQLLDKEARGEITFHFKHQNEEITWTENVQNGNIRSTLFKELYFKSEVYLTTSTLAFDRLYLTVYPF